MSRKFFLVLAMKWIVLQKCTPKNWLSNLCCIAFNVKISTHVLEPITFICFIQPNTVVSRTWSTAPRLFWEAAASARTSIDGKLKIIRPCKTNTANYTKSVNTQISLGSKSKVLALKTKWKSKPFPDTFNLIFKVKKIYIQGFPGPY